MGAQKRYPDRPIPGGRGVSDAEGNRQRLIEIRHLLGLTQREMAEEIGVRPDGYPRYEHGTRPVPDNRLRLAERALQRAQAEQAKVGQT